MAFEATKRELGELYTFFRLLADGKVSLGTPQARKDETKCWPVALCVRLRCFRLCGSCPG